VVEGETGFLIEGADPGRFAALLPEVDRLNRGRIAAHAGQFSTEVFTTRVTAWIADETA
jgi:hypothetical protein